MPHPKVKIADDDGNTVAVDTSSNALHVKLAESIDVGMLGDVNIKLNGTDVSPGADTMDNGTIRIALATDDTQFGEIGADEFLQDVNIKNFGRGRGYALSQMELKPLTI